jgi:hypothetical protein
VTPTPEAESNSVEPSMREFACLAGARLCQPGRAPLPWKIRQVARGVAARFDIPYDVALELVCEGVEEARS